jgi:two-component SAPR family response regulator
MRERVRARFIQTVTSAAAALENDNRFADALSLYRRAIDADDLACAFNDGVVRCLRRLGRGPEAESTGRCERQSRQT